jgi:hypothetical protein
MRNTLTFPSFKRPTADVDSSFNVVIAYEDFETGKHGKKTYDFLVQNLGEECRFDNQMWKFDVLAVPKLREMAAKDAVAADIIIISAHGQSELPMEVKSWMELWLSEKTNAIAIVGLFDLEAYEDNAARTYLAEVAQRAGIEFFAQPGPWPKQEAPLQLFGNWERNSANFSALSAIAQREKDVSHWGINE